MLFVEGLGQLGSAPLTGETDLEARVAAEHARDDERPRFVCLVTSLKSQKVASDCTFEWSNARFGSEPLSPCVAPPEYRIQKLWIRIYAVNSSNGYLVLSLCPVELLRLDAVHVKEALLLLLCALNPLLGHALDQGAEAANRHVDQWHAGRVQDELGEVRL
jgi:hypothetical protein